VPDNLFVFRWIKQPLTDGEMNILDNFRASERGVAVGRTLKSQAIILGGFVLLIWFLELVDSLILSGSLDTLGVQPRTLVGLRGILFMPFLHNGFGHVLANTIPFFILGWLVMLGGIPQFFVVVAVTMIVSGLGTWLFGSSNSVHIGASGLVFGFLGFLITRAYFERSLVSIALALFVFVLYGGILLGALPLQSGISWQGHLFGFIGGALAAYLLTLYHRRDQS
jgi:membrane associated rhomboid family serine protease